MCVCVYPAATRCCVIAHVPHCDAGNRCGLAGVDTRQVQKWTRRISMTIQCGYESARSRRWIAECQMIQLLIPAEGRCRGRGPGSCAAISLSCTRGVKNSSVFFETSVSCTICFELKNGMGVIPFKPFFTSDRSEISRFLS